MGEGRQQARKLGKTVRRPRTSAPCLCFCGLAPGAASCTALAPPPAGGAGRVGGNGMVSWVSTCCDLSTGGPCPPQERSASSFNPSNSQQLAVPLNQRAALSPQLVTCLTLVVF